MLEQRSRRLNVAGARFIGGSPMLIALALIAVFPVFFASAQETNNSMRKQGTTSDHWLDEFYWWLEAHKLTTPGK